jgi:hypothetical protein
VEAVDSCDAGGGIDGWEGAGEEECSFGGGVWVERGEEVRGVERTGCSVLTGVIGPGLVEADEGRTGDENDGDGEDAYGDNRRGCIPVGSVGWVGESERP